MSDLSDNLRAYLFVFRFTYSSETMKISAILGAVLVMFVVYNDANPINGQTQAPPEATAVV